MHQSTTKRHGASFRQQWRPRQDVRHHVFVHNEPERSRTSERTGMSKWSIGKKFGVGFGIVFTLLCGALGFYHCTVRSVTSGFHNLLATDLVTATDAGAIATDMLQLRRHEKDFLLRKDLQDPEQFASTFATMRGRIEALSHLAQQSGDTKLTERTQAMLQLSDTYTETFKKVVDAWVKLGLD